MPDISEIYAQFFLGSILVALIGYVEGKIVSIVLEDTDEEPLDRFLCWSDDIRACKKPWKILG